jgi:hypothetical protein
MKRVWRISVEEGHALFVALWENAKNTRLKAHRAENVAVWLETLRSGPGLSVAPTDTDAEFFSALVEQELIRLAFYEAEDNVISCGCKVYIHRRALQQFRLRNLEP